VGNATNPPSFKISLARATADVKHDHEILRLAVLVKRYVSRFATGNHQLSKPFLDRAADHRMTLEHGERVKDEACGLSCRRRILSQQEIRQPLEIGLRALLEC
jgi:hypothetical protein